MAQQPKDKASIHFLALGDSYTIGESVEPDERWPHQLADRLSARGKSIDSVHIIATTGWRTDELMTAINHASLQPDWDLVGLLIGVNNQYQGRPLAQYRKEFPELLAKAIELADGDTGSVFVVSIPDYAFTPFGQTHEPNKISTELDVYNTINDSVATAWKVQYFNITPISRQGVADPKLVAKDNLHPSGEQYKRWAELILSKLDW